MLHNFSCNQTKKFKNVYCIAAIRNLTPQLGLCMKKRANPYEAKVKTLSLPQNHK
jgi:hypothetical protein